jgi:AcrR family transcriptional regulator
MPRMTAAQRQAETRARLVDAATTTFQERGYLAASLEEISERAGYSQGAIYSNFKGKEALFLGCIERLAESRTTVWEDFIANAKELGAQPESFGKVLVSVLLPPEWNKALVEFRIAAISEPSRQSLIENHQRWRNIVVRLLEVYCATNKITPTIPLEAIADSLVATVDGLRFQALTQPEVDIAGIFATTLRLLLAGAVTKIE